MRAIALCLGVALVTLTARAVAREATAQALKSPTALAATSASRRAVALSWTPGDPGLTTFIVERKPLGASWTPPPPPAKSPIVSTPVSATTAADSAIDPFGTYVYRVRASGAAGALSAPSNEIVVGPPPVGFSQVVVAPAAMQDSSRFGLGLSLALDANSDPAIAYHIYDPNGDDNAEDTTLQFVSWNRAQYRWNAPVQVGVVGLIDTGTARKGLSLAFDASTNRFALAHMQGTREVRIAMSTDGVVWQDQVVDVPDEGSSAEPSLALAGGRVVLAYAIENSVRVRTGAQTDPPSKWTTETAPILPGMWRPRKTGISVAIDGTGKPAVAYWIDPDSGQNMALAIWRPGQSAPAKIADTADYQNDVLEARLAFSGTRAAAAFVARRDEKFFDGEHEIWFSSSADGGATWTPVVPLPADGGHGMGTPISLALDRQGHPALVAPFSHGNDSGARCGRPELIRSTDGVKWTTCAPGGKGTPTGSPDYAHVVFADNDKLYVAFTASSAGGALKAGLVLWRE